MLNLISCISLAIVWTYWSDTLNNCPETNCGCIFFGHLRSTTFVGGQPIWCRSIIYFTLIATIVSFVISVYFFIKLRTTPKNIPNRVSQTDDDIPSRSRYWFSYFTLWTMMTFEITFSAHNDKVLLYRANIF